MNRDVMLVRYNNKNYYVKYSDFLNKANNKLFAYEDNGLQNIAKVNGKTLIFDKSKMEDKLKNSIKMPTKMPSNLATENVQNDIIKIAGKDMGELVKKIPIEDIEKSLEYFKNKREIGMNQFLNNMKIKKLEKALEHKKKYNKSLENKITTEMIGLNPQEQEKVYKYEDYFRLQNPLQKKVIGVSRTGRVSIQVTPDEAYVLTKSPKGNLFMAYGFDTSAKVGNKRDSSLDTIDINLEGLLRKLIKINEQSITNEAKIRKYVREQIHKILLGEKEIARKDYDSKIFINEGVIKEAISNERDFLLQKFSSPGNNREYDEKRFIQNVKDIPYNQKILSRLDKFIEYLDNLISMNAYGYITPHETIKTRKHTYPADVAIDSSYRVYDLAEMLESKFKYIKNFVPLTVEGNELYITGLDIASYWYDMTFDKIRKGNKLKENKMTNEAKIRKYIREQVYKILSEAEEEKSEEDIAKKAEAAKKKKKKDAYKQFFSKALAKFGYSGVSSIPDEKKKEFFDFIDSAWISKQEKSNGTK